MDQQINLSDRLLKIAGFVDKDTIVADVGTDHAYIPIYLVKHKMAKKVYALDINKGPLIKAKENIAYYGVDKDIETIQSNGLMNLNEKVDSVIIAGMGGMLISNILNDSKEKIKGIEKFILSPHLDFEEVRRTVHKVGLKIVDEEFLREGNKYYPIIVCKRGKEEYTKLEYKFGKLLIENKNETLKAYLLNMKTNNENILLNLKNKNTMLSNSRVIEVEKELEDINEVIKCL